jgi:hypothetical protein
MKTQVLIYLSITIAALTGLASAGEPVRAEINAALRYYQAFLLAPDISEADMDYLATNNLFSGVLPARFGQIVGRYDAEFKVLRQAADSSLVCNWGLDASEGPAILLPHLARCKAVMVGARYRVAWALQQNRQDQARDDLLAAFTLARNASRDGTLISVLVQVAAESIGCNIIAENYGKFSSQTFQDLIQGIDALPARGTASASVAFEKITFHDWLLRKIVELQKTNPGDEARVMSGIREIVSGLQGNESGEQNAPGASLWDQLTKAAGNTSEGILKLVSQEGQVYDRLAVVMALPYAEFDSVANQLHAELKQFENPLIAPSVPACLKARQREFKVQVWFAMLHTALAYRLHGDSGLLSVTDPCGQGPFAFQRFVFQGVDRGFQLKSSFEGSSFPETMIFVEKSGPPFLLDGPHVGEARLMPKSQK